MKKRIFSMMLILAILAGLLPLPVLASALVEPDREEYAGAASTPSALTDTTFLTFTAQEANSTITFQWKSGSDVQISTDGGANWTDYAAGTEITLGNIGDKVSFKGTNVVTDYSNHFTMSGKIAASGDVTSLTNGTGGDATLAEGCYGSMFEGCTALTAAPALPATTLVMDCYGAMFRDCTSLETAPELPATALAEYCYAYMFQGCTALTTAPTLPATALAKGCYYRMLRDCTALRTAPELPAATLVTECYGDMFRGCTSLETAPALPAKSLAEYCYAYMFRDCTALRTAPDLPATTLAARCYASMFYGCTALTSAPDLPATTLAAKCYSFMFEGCTSLEAAPTLPATTLAEGCYSYMFWGCRSLIAAPELPVVTLAKDCYRGMFEGCRSLTAAPALPAATLAEGCYAGMFGDCTSLTAAPALPADALAENCYEYMFIDCTSLTAAPALPATTLAAECYAGMFCGCTSLTAAPELPATTLAEGCYSYMFRDCTALKTAPELPATTLAGGCYSYMFWDCTALRTAPELPATTLAKGCYFYMFEDCTALTAAPELPATTLAARCYYGMFESCTSLTTAPTLPATTLAENCYSNMFANCTALETAPALPATTLAAGCYGIMFWGCTSLETAPALPATTLAAGCYGIMFWGCTALETAPALPATTLAGGCYGLMFGGCTSLTTAPTLPATTLAARCYYLMFQNCTALKLNTSGPGAEWSIPAGAVAAEDWNKDMFTGTGGSFTGGPAIGTVYYIDVTTCTVTFDANGGSVGTASATTGADGRLASLPAPTRSGSYSFDGWYDAASGGTQVTTSTVFTANTTVYAHWTYTGGSSSNDSSGGYTPPSAPAVTVPVSSDNNQVNVSAAISGSTATVSKIDTGEIERVIGSDGQAGLVEIDFTTQAKPIDTVKLPAAAIEQITAAAQSKDIDGLTIKLSGGEITFDSGALTAIRTQEGSQITLSLAPAKPTDLNARQKETVGSAPTYDLTVKSGGSSISDFKGGTVTVSLPYALTAGQKPAGVVVYYLDGRGNTTPCHTRYDTGRECAVFTTGHLSLYFVGYDTAAVWENPYSDIAEGDWYYDAVRFVSESGLMGGYGNGTFGPDSKLTRAQFAQVLYNKEGRPAATGGSVFTDAVSGAWYTDAVTWAAAQGIVSGYGDGKFGPGDPITREQLAVMLYRYAGKPATSGTLDRFTDADEVSGYALEALRWAVENGILNGCGDGRLGPQEQSTRAQVAQMLKNLISK